jgi:hypothetical protein
LIPTNEMGQHVLTSLTRTMEDKYVLPPSSYSRVLRFSWQVNAMIADERGRDLTLYLLALVVRCVLPGLRKVELTT